LIRVFNSVSKPKTQQKLLDEVISFAWVVNR